MDLSIIIASYNTKDLTLACIDSLLKEGSKINSEIIVVDDHSSDGSVAALKKRENKKEIKLVINEKNRGFAKTNNNGIKIASGKYVLLLNSDTIVKKESLGKLLRFAEKTKDAGVIGSKLLNKDGSLQASCFHFPTVVNAFKEYFLGERGLFEKYAPRGNKPVVVDAVVGAVFLMTPKALKRVGMLDERYFVYFEDIAYCREVKRAGLKVYYYPKAEIIHHHGATFKKLAGPDERWKKLIPGSKIYHGLFKYYLINTVIRLGQLWQKISN